MILVAACIHSLVWAVFIMAMPELAAKVYGFTKTPRELHLWQGTGLFILLLGIGFGLAAGDPIQHWGLVLMGFMAKMLGAAGMCFAVFQGQESTKVLWLLPINDIIWCVPFLLIILHARRQCRRSGV